MADPKLEDGYTKISNELLEAIYSSDLNGTQFKIVLFIIRSTYGYNKKEHSISVSFISQGTGLDSRHLRRELNILIDINVIKVTKEATFSSSRNLAINKNYEEWRLIRHQEHNSPTEGELDLTTEGELDLTTEGELDLQKRKYKNKDKDNVNPQMKDELKIQSEDLWKMYPEKKGKAIAMKKIPKLVKEHGAEQIQRTIERYIKEIKTKDIKPPYILHGSTFFNGSYVDYLDENYTEQSNTGKIIADKYYVIDG